LCRLEGKVALITGGASGIGECTVKLFVRHGARVVVADIKDEKGRSLCAALGLDVASYVHCDVTSEADVKNAVDTAVSLHGKLDIMFNNAGVALGRDHGFLNGEHSASLFERMMAVNVLGVYLGTKHAARVMAPARSGCIVTTASSVSALGGMAPAFYTCSKYAVVGLMRSAAAELGKFGVRANCVSPHLLATPMTSAALGMTEEEVERLLDAGANLKGVTAKPEDIAEAVLYLASDESRYVSGHNLFLEHNWSWDLELEGKVALITGGASGIGECTAKLFAQHGARVVVVDIQDDKGHSLCADLGPAVASYVHCDVTIEADVKHAVDTAVSLHGKLDIMFNNAGVVDDLSSGFLNCEKSAFEKVVAVNVLGAYLGTKHAARVMAPARAGSIVTTASAASVMGGLASPAYTCSKHAVVGLMRCAAAELGPFRVRANCVSPHAVATPMAKTALGFTDDEEVERLVEATANLKGTMLKAQDLAEAVLYLGSDESRYVSGHNLLVDGGFTVTKRW
ncbi:unnamed protein product, partial [Musa hybrid cultivar]